MTPMQAIVATTGAGAKLLKIDRDLGTVAEGKVADLVLVQGDPLLAIGLLRRPDRVVLVMQGGRIVKNLIPDRVTPATQ